MKPTELAAHRWLQEQYGYSSADIEFRYGDSPDFVCIDGGRWEVKRIEGRAVTFTVRQIFQLRKAPTTVLLWRDSGHEPAGIYDLADIPLPGRWADFVSYVSFQPCSAPPVQVKAGELETFIDRYLAEHPSETWGPAGAA